MRVFFWVGIFMLLIAIFFSCKNADRNAIRENHPSDTTKIKILENQFLLGSHLCREPMANLGQVSTIREPVKHRINLLRS